LRGAAAMIEEAVTQCLKLLPGCAEAGTNAQQRKNKSAALSVFR
jgi:hypothetical protein